ncbi:pimeloyl-ACP methyl ester carboxylesterase [Peribacillus frigoritolerans]|uniref:alpha/beta fold hydrolase n=1 Tax=Peribacillus frigoritolerans TaxID=450367 RepID=UPI0020D20EC8
MSGFVTNEGKQEYINSYHEAMSYLPQPVESKMLNTVFGKVKLYKFQEEETPDKTPLLLLPGKGSATPMWEANLNDFLKHRPVYTIDLIGEPGLSIETKRIKTNMDQAIWLKQVLEQLPEEEINLLGLSFGGWSAANLAIKHPEKIQTLILVEPVYVFGPIPLKMILVSIPASVPAVPKSIRERMLSYISGGAKIDESEPAAKLIETGMRTYKSKLPMPEKVKTEHLKKLKMPVLGILGGQSTMHHSEKSFQIGLENLRNPYSNMVLFEDASHAINGEYPEKLLQTIEDFLKHIE